MEKNNYTMALNPQTVKFLFDQVQNASYKTFGSIISQLFEYLKLEVKDNPVYNKFQNDYLKWSEYIKNRSHGDWELPADFDEAKSFSYSVYQYLYDDKDHFNFSYKFYGAGSQVDIASNVNHDFISYLAKALEDIINANPEIDTVAPKKVKGDAVFIIHGHDNELKVQLQLLLKIAGVNNFVLHEQADLGRTIIEKLVQETETSGYAIALLTPDDLVDDGKNRARQNVILELGYFLGKIGKERVRIIVRDNVEIPSDLHGILYEKYDNAGAWKMKLLKEIQAVGIYVDLEAVVKTF